MNEVYIMSATRSPVGAFGGSLKDFTPVDLGAIVAKEQKDPQKKWGRPVLAM